MAATLAVDVRRGLRRASCLELGAPADGSRRHRLGPRQERAFGPPAADGNYAVDHTAAIFLVDPEGRFAALFNTPHEAGAIARDYRRIVAAR